MLAEAATLTATDEAGDVHLGTGLCEGEVAGTQTNLGVGTKHLLGKREQHLLEVGERYVLVDIESFHLMEEAVGAGCDGLVTINAAWADDANRLRERRMFFVTSLGCWLTKKVSCISRAG